MRGKEGIIFRKGDGWMQFNTSCLTRSVAVAPPSAAGEGRRARLRVTHHVLPPLTRPFFVRHSRRSFLLYKLLDGEEERMNLGRGSSQYLNR